MPNPKTTTYDNAKAAFIISFLLFVINGQLLTIHLQALTAVPPPATAAPPPNQKIHTMREIFKTNRPFVEATAYLLNIFAFMFLINLSIKNPTEIVLNVTIILLDGGLACCMAMLYSDRIASGLLIITFLAALIVVSLQSDRIQHVISVLQTWMVTCIRCPCRTACCDVSEETKRTQDLEKVAAAKEAMLQEAQTILVASLVKALEDRNAQ